MLQWQCPETNGQMLQITLPSRLMWGWQWHSPLYTHSSQNNLHSYRTTQSVIVRFRMTCWSTSVERGERDGAGTGLRGCRGGRCTGCRHCHRSLTTSSASSTDRRRHCRRSASPRTTPPCRCRSRTGRPRGVGSPRRLSPGCAATQTSDCVSDRPGRPTSWRPSETCCTVTVLQ